MCSAPDGAAPGYYGSPFNPANNATWVNGGLVITPKTPAATIQSSAPPGSGPAAPTAASSGPTAAMRQGAGIFGNSLNITPSFPMGGGGAVQPSGLAIPQG